MPSAGAFFKSNLEREICRSIFDSVEIGAAHSCCHTKIDLGDTKVPARLLDSLAKNLFRTFVHAAEFEMELNKNVNYSLLFAESQRVFYVGFFGPHVPSHASHKQAPPKLVVVEAECLSPDERAAFALLSSRVAAVLVPCPAQGELAIQCQTHSCSLNQAAVIATSQRGLPLLLEAGTALTLRGDGYENEAAADMVFKPRSSGGLRSSH